MVRLMFCFLSLYLSVPVTRPLLCMWHKLLFFTSVGQHSEKWVQSSTCSGCSGGLSSGDPISAVKRLGAHLPCHPVPGQKGGDGWDHQVAHFPFRDTWFCSCLQKSLTLFFFCVKHRLVSCPKYLEWSKRETHLVCLLETFLPRLSTQANTLFCSISNFA